LEVGITVIVPLLAFSLHVFIITSSRVCTNSSVFVFIYWFDEEDEIEEDEGD
jgi:hypothetical protein